MEGGFPCSKVNRFVRTTNLRKNIGISVKNKVNQPGCFRYGCFVAGTIFVVLTSFLVWWSVRSVRLAYEFYTSEQGAPFVVEVPQSADVQHRGAEKINRLMEAYEGNKSLKLEFTSAELNGGLQQRGLGSNLLVDVVDSRIELKFSLPLGFFGEWPAAEIILGDMTARHVVGELSATVRIDKGEPEVALEKLVLKRRALEDMAREHASEWLVGAIRSGLETKRSGSPLVSLSALDSRVYVELTQISVD